MFWFRSFFCPKARKSQCNKQNKTKCVSNTLDIFFCSFISYQFESNGQCGSTLTMLLMFQSWVSLCVFSGFCLCAWFLKVKLTITLNEWMNWGGGDASLNGSVLTSSGCYHMLHVMVSNFLFQSCSVTWFHLNNELHTTQAWGFSQLIFTYEAL